MQSSWSSGTGRGTDSWSHAHLSFSGDAEEGAAYVLDCDIDVMIGRKELRIRICRRLMCTIPVGLEQIVRVLPDQCSECLDEIPSVDATWMAPRLC
jgi:hypothetical protein